MPQLGNQLENRRSQDDEVSRRMWKVVETKAEKISMAETERRGGKRGSRIGARRKGKGKGEKTEKTKEEKNDRYKKNSERIGNMGGGRRSSEVGDRGQEASSREVSQVDQSLWQEKIGASACKKGLGSYH